MPTLTVTLTDAALSEARMALRRCMNQTRRDLYQGDFSDEINESDCERYQEMHFAYLDIAQAQDAYFARP